MDKPILKYYETTYSDYLHAFNQYNIHPELDLFRSCLPDHIVDLPNLILYGSCGVGRYTQALSIICKYSPTNLRYNNKIYIFEEKNESVSQVVQKQSNTNEVELGEEVDLSNFGCFAAEYSADVTDTIVTSVSGSGKTSKRVEPIKLQTSTKLKSATKPTKTVKCTLSKVKPTKPKPITKPVVVNPTTEPKPSTKTKNDFVYHISDVHYEIDMPSLGCNAKTLWHEIYYHIVDIVTLSPMRAGIVVCKNFNLIHNELLSVFYSYMHHPLNHQNIHLRFILLTEHVCFLPNDIVNSCHIVPVRRPELAVYKRMASVNMSATKVPFKLDVLNDIELSSIKNLKEVYALTRINTTESIPEDMFDKITLQLYTLLFPDGKSSNNLDIYALRNRLYNLLIFNIDIYDTVWYILSRIQTTNLRSPSITQFYTFFKHYNNNYRSIYHLERIFISITQLK